MHHYWATKGKIILLKISLKIDHFCMQYIYTKLTKMGPYTDLCMKGSWILQRNSSESLCLPQLFLLFPHHPALSRKVLKM